MKVLFITKQKSVAGSSYSVSYLAKGLAEKGHDVWLGARKEAFLLKLVESDKQLKTVHFAFKGYADWKTSREIAAFVKEHKIDIVNAQSGQDRFMMVLARFLFGLSAKVVFTRRQRPRDEPWIKRFLHTKTASIVVISDGLKILFKKKGYREDQLKVIYNGLPKALNKAVDPATVHVLRQQYRIPEGNKVVGCISRLKEQHQIIRACPFLAPNITLLFVGIEQAQVQEVIDDVAPQQHLVFTSVLDHQQVLNHYPLMDVNILASKMDGFGLTLVEAMALGVPVIGSDFGGIRSVIGDNENGLLFENGDIHGLADQINALLYDQLLRENLIKKGREAYLTRFNIEQTITAYEAYFQELLK
ncbi:MAG: glycosyltransferase family 4 protein [Cytophagales bacterium]|nr:glycosyltransferase family 4 protein [Cytophagales bacterium]